MRPAARLQAAAEILDGLPEPGADIERALREWGRAHRFAGSGDRAAIADIVFDCLRCWRSFGLMMGESGRGRMLAGLIEQGEDPNATRGLGFGERHAPAPLSDEEGARWERLLAAGPQALLAAEAAPAPARCDWPDWLWTELARSVEQPTAEAAALRRRAPFDLRVNTEKADRETARAALAAEGVEAVDAPLSPIGLRVAPGVRIAGGKAFAEGLVEPQGAASQAAALLSGAAPGERVLDYCAGAGGKALAFAAMMRDRGEVLAHDVAPERLRELPERQRRAGAGSIRIVDANALDALGAAFDLVFVDAPCSGSGVWARQPAQKWALTRERLAALGRAQESALEAAARFVRPGGRLIYATCSLLRCENRDRVEAFLAIRDDFAVARLDAAWRREGLLGAPPNGALAQFLPRRHEVDGFFIAAMRRSSSPR